MFADLEGIFRCKQSSWVSDENLGPVGPYKGVKKILSFVRCIFKMSSCIGSENSKMFQNLRKVLIRLHLIHQCACVPAHLVLVPFIAKVFDQTLHAFRCRAPPVGPGVGTKGLVSDQEGHTQTTKYVLYNHAVTVFNFVKLYDSIVPTQCQQVVCAAHSETRLEFIDEL